MRRLLVAAAAAALLLAGWVVARRLIPAHVEYRGEQIRLTRFYLDYDEYKNDPENLARFENARVARLVESAPVPSSVRSRFDAARVAGAVQFPGYGMGSLGGSVPGDTSLLAFSVEIPRAGKDRVIVYRLANGEYRLVDDFLAPEEPSIMRVALEESLLVYRTFQGDRLTARPPRSESVRR